jgi:hypothetical protein
MQQFSFIDLFIDLFKAAVHVSDDKLAHLQEQFLTVCTALVQCTEIAADRSAAISVRCTKAVHTVESALKMGEFGARNMYSRLKKINKRKLLHLVGCLHRSSNDVRSHKR